MDLDELKSAVYRCFRSRLASLGIDPDTPAMSGANLLPTDDINLVEDPDRTLTDRSALTDVRRKATGGKKRQLERDSSDSDSGSESEEYSPRYVPFEEKRDSLKVLLSWEC